MEIRESLLSQKIDSIFTKKKALLFSLGIILLFIISFALDPYLFSLEWLTEFRIFRIQGINSNNFLSYIPHFYSIVLLFSVSFVFLKKISLFKLFLRDICVPVSILLPYIIIANHANNMPGPNEFGIILIIFLFFIIPIVFIFRSILLFLQKLITGKIIYNRYTPAIWATVLSVLTLIQAIL